MPLEQGTDQQRGKGEWDSCGEASDFSGVVGSHNVGLA